MYENGQGVPQDYKTAVKWYSLAAEQGHGSAQSNLGSMYYKGDSVPQDYVRALMWCNIAASSADIHALGEIRNRFLKSAASVGFVDGGREGLGTLMQRGRSPERLLPPMPVPVDGTLLCGAPTTLRLSTGFNAGVTIPLSPTKKHVESNVD
jgi:TPR repeat protein